MPWQRRNGRPANLLLTVLAALVSALAIASFCATPVHAQVANPADDLHPRDQAAFVIEPRRRRVAIIGAGASGSAAAFFLNRAAREAEHRQGLLPNSLLDEIVVYERADYIGGRSTVIHPHGDKNLPPYELGASIFVDANRNLMKAVKLFNLSTEPPAFSESGVAIWDGRELLFETSTAKSRLNRWWDTVAAIKRYGVLSPYRQGAAVKALLTDFKKLYQPEWLARRGIVSSIAEFAETANLGRWLTTRTGEDWAKNVARVSTRWADEIIEASTRVNYCADLDRIHALGAAVSLAAAGATSVNGGNFQIFEHMLKSSGAKVHLKTAVKRISSTQGESGPAFRIGTTSAKGVHEDGEFDQVFLAAPWQDSYIDKGIADNFTEKIPKTEYVRLHVTFLTTTAPWPSPSYFGVYDDRAIPGTILTTNATFRTGVGGDKPPQPKFQSISYHGETYPGSGEYVVKIFSKTKLDDDFLNTLFGAEPTWVARHLWHSYPVLEPVVEYPPVEPMPGLHYLAAMEPWVSTMETQTISAREAVARVATKWWGLGLGQCRDGQSWDLTCE